MDAANSARCKARDALNAQGWRVLSMPIGRRMSESGRYLRWTAVALAERWLKLTVFASLSRPAPEWSAASERSLLVDAARTSRRRSGTAHCSAISNAALPAGRSSTSPSRCPETSIPSRLSASFRIKTDEHHVPRQSVSSCSTIARDVASTRLSVWIRFQRQDVNSPCFPLATLTHRSIRSKCRTMSSRLSRRGPGVGVGCVNMRRR